MRYALTKTVTASQKSIIAHHGDAVWEHMIDNLSTVRQSFTVALVAKTLGRIMPDYTLRYRTDIARTVIANVLEEHAHDPDECPFTRRGNVYYWKC